MERFNDLYCCGPALKARYAITFLDSVEGFREVGSTTVNLYNKINNKYWVY